MPAVRAVLDTNILVSGALGGRTRRWLEPALKAARVIPVLSPPSWYELRTVLERPELALSGEEAGALVRLLGERAILVVPTQSVTACRDPKDNALLECALAARADALVTGDKDLLALHPFHGIPIVSPTAFIARFL